MIQFKNKDVTVFQSSLYQTTTTVLLTEDLVLVVDPNWLPREISEVQSYVSQIKGHRELLLLFTHSDFDHIIGYKAFPEAKTIGSVEMNNHSDKQSIVNQIIEFDTKQYITRNYPIEFPKLDFVIEQDGQQITVGGTTLTFYNAPGHARDGIFTIVDHAGIFLAGDYLSDFELPFIYHSAKEYEKTIRKADDILDHYNIGVLIPGHGQTTTSNFEMKRRVSVSQDYLQRLKQAVISNDEHAISVLGREHAFPSAFTELCHNENMKIIRNEYLS